MEKKRGLWNKLVDYLGFGPDEDDFDDDMEEAATLPEAWPADIKRSPDRRAQVVPISAAPQKNIGFKVLVVEPRSFEEVQTIVDQMRARRPVILNLESLDKDLAQKILNFLNGAIYALGGETQRVSTGIFFFAPQGTDITTMGRGITGTAIGGGAIDLPPGVLEKITGSSGKEEGEVSRSTDRGRERQPAEDWRTIDWRKR